MRLVAASDEKHPDPEEFLRLLPFDGRTKRQDHGARHDCGFEIAECGFQINAEVRWKLIGRVFVVDICSVSKIRTQSMFSLDPPLTIRNPHCEIQNNLITLSALANTFGGIVRPICLAVFRLMMNSNFFGCSTGRSAGLAPFKILST